MLINKQCVTERLFTQNRKGRGDLGGIKCMKIWSTRKKISRIFIFLHAYGLCFFLIVYMRFIFGAANK